jgi:hypothetical protein
LAGSYPGALVVLLGLPDGGFGVQPVISYPGRSKYLVSGDYNGDGLQDLVVTYAVDTDAGTYEVYSGVNAVDFLPGLGDGTFGAPMAVGTVPNGQHLVAGDFDHDGRLDIAEADNNGGVAVLYNNGCPAP